MCFNPVADAWWEKKPRIVDFAAFEPRNVARGWSIRILRRTSRTRGIEDRGEKVPLSFHIIYALSVSERPANLNTKYKNKGRNHNQSLPIPGPKVTRDCYSPSGLATIWP